MVFDFGINQFKYNNVRLLKFKDEEIQTKNRSTYLLRFSDQYICLQQKWQNCSILLALHIQNPKKGLCELKFFYWEVLTLLSV